MRLRLLVTFALVVPLLAIRADHPAAAANPLPAPSVNERAPAVAPQGTTVKIAFLVDGASAASDFTVDLPATPTRRSPAPNGGTVAIYELPKQTHRASAARGDTRTFDYKPVIAYEPSAANGGFSITLGSVDNRVASATSTKAWSPKTTFLARVTITVGNKTFVHDQSTFISCFESSTLIRRMDGVDVPISTLVAGEYVYDPVQRAPARVDVVIRGEEASPLIRITRGAKSVVVTQMHPVPLRRGVVAAKDVHAGDELLGDDRAYLPIESVESLAIATSRPVVYNLRLAGDARHVLANGLVMGDQIAQEGVARTSTAVTPPPAAR